MGPVEPVVGTRDANMSIRWSIDEIVDAPQLLKWSRRFPLRKSKFSQLCGLLTGHQHSPLLMRDYAAEETINDLLQGEFRD